jgi:hypothetical protein
MKDLVSKEEAQWDKKVIPGMPVRLRLNPSWCIADHNVFHVLSCSRNQALYPIPKRKKDRTNVVTCTCCIDWRFAVGTINIGATSISRLIPEIPS